MALANTGKGFEEDIKKSVPESWSVYRLVDDMGGFKGVTNMCDFILSSGKALIYAELKSYKAQSIPLNNISQRSTLLKHTGKFNIFPALFLNFRTVDKTFYLGIEKLALITDRKSISVSFCEKHGIIIPANKLRTHYRYDLEAIEKELFKTGKLIAWTKL